MPGSAVSQNKVISMLIPQITTFVGVLCGPTPLLLMEKLEIGDSLPIVRCCAEVVYMVTVCLNFSYLFLYEYFQSLTV